MPENTIKPLDVARIRGDFPSLHQEVNGHPLVYLDNAASAQTPTPVLEAMNEFFTRNRSNIHRGVHTLSQRASADFDGVRHKVARFLGVTDEAECLFVRGTTEGLNLVAQSWGRSNLEAGDEIIISWLEHHSNIVPWQLLCEQTGAVLRVVPIDDRGDFLFDEYLALLSDRTRIVSVAHASNALGTILPLRQIADEAHKHGAIVVVDGAQGAPHIPLNMGDLGCDFYAFSAHKVPGPTGVGVLWGRRKILEAMPPWHGGGDMIESVTFEKTTYAPLPAKFEAGTPSVAGVIGLGAALTYMEGLGATNIAACEQDLLEYGTTAFQNRLPDARIIGTAPEKTGSISFVIQDIHPHDLGTVLDQQGIAVRAGHHCAQPVMDRFGISATTRASFAFYNTHAEIDTLVDALQKAQEMFKA